MYLHNRFMYTADSWAELYDRMTLARRKVDIICVLREREAEVTSGQGVLS